MLDELARNAARGGTLTAVSAATTAATELTHALRGVLRGEVDDSTRRRAEYSTDASNYRVVPQVVAFPRDVDDAVAAVETARGLGIPVTSRGGGTSVAGNAVGTGLVLDWSRHVNRVHEIDPEAGTARVDPGVVMAMLQRQAAPHGLWRFWSSFSCLSVMSRSMRVSAGGN